MHKTSAIPQFMIAAPSSNSGKTTLTLGLLKAFSNRGMRVQPYKCGPDYIDPILHKKACGISSINLDTYMASPGHVTGLYSRYLHEKDLALVEGVMGLFDGADKMKGSSAEIALLLDIPVILVINASAMAYSAAALIHGFKTFRPALRLCGVIFNKVNSASHYRFLQDACADCAVEALGYLPTQPEASIPSRHLGLSLAAEIDMEKVCTLVAQSLEKTVDLDRLLALTSNPVSLPVVPTQPVTNEVRTIAVASDEAFCFTYVQNLEVLKRFGRLVFFSPLNDATLPDCDLLYLPGGYPELFLDELSQNTSMLTSIKTYCLAGGKTFGECGGMMYLGKSITGKEGGVYPMVDFLPVSTSMEHPKLHLGYRTLEIDDLSLKGHEFHYSTCLELAGAEKLSATLTNAKGIMLPPSMYLRQQTLASYHHLYWAEETSFIEKLLAGKITTNQV